MYMVTPTWDKFDAFITQLKRNLLAHFTSFASNHSKINYAMLFMKGGQAQQWAI